MNGEGLSEPSKTRRRVSAGIFKLVIGAGMGVMGSRRAVAKTVVGVGRLGGIIVSKGAEGGLAVELAEGAAGEVAAIGVAAFSVHPAMNAINKANQIIARSNLTRAPVGLDGKIPGIDQLFCRF